MTRQNFVFQAHQPRSACSPRPPLAPLDQPPLHRADWCHIWMYPKENASIVTLPAILFPSPFSVQYWGENQTQWHFILWSTCARLPPLPPACRTFYTQPSLYDSHCYCKGHLLSTCAKFPLDPFLPSSYKFQATYHYCHTQKLVICLAPPHPGKHSFGQQCTLRAGGG